MATILFSQIADGSVVAFDSYVDQLRFDAPGLDAASLFVTYAADETHIQIAAGGIRFGLTPSVALDSLDYWKIGFAEPSYFDVDTLYFDADNLVWGAGGNDQLFGRDGNDTLEGGAGGDVLNGGAGNDRLDGGAGNDTARYADASSAVTVDLSTRQSSGGGGRDKLVSIENIDGSRFSDRLTGNTLANRLDGREGADTLTGGAGADLYTADDAGDRVVEAAGGGVDEVRSLLGSYRLPENVENGRIVADGAADMTGNAAANLLVAGRGDNVLDGGAGIDTASYANAAAGVAVSLAVASGQTTGGSGTDRLVSIERLVGSAFNDTLTGNAGANRIEGGAGADRLDGGAGADTLAGGTGSDTYVIDNAADVVAESDASAAGGNDMVLSRLAAYTLARNVEGGTVAAAGAANLTGNGLANLLVAGRGNNLLDGGAGTDTASWAGASVGVAVSLAIAGPQAIRGSGTDRLVSIENLAGSSWNDRLTGNASANALFGGAGSDTMIGGGGRDTYYVRDAGDIVVEAAGGGRDHVHSWLAAYTLGNWVEDGSIRSSGAAKLTGNALGNTLHAGRGNNTLDGGAGFDTASWAGASAAVVVDLARTDAQVTGGSGRDRLISIEALTGTALADRLSGDAGANRLDGGAGDDRLDGAAGDDTLVGGIGNDRFRVDAVGDTVVEGANGGIDHVDSLLAAYTLAANVENGRILAVGNAALTGNSLANVIVAAAGDNLIDGGAGIDTASWADASAGVTIDLARRGPQASGGSGSETLVSIENLTGSAFRDRLTGNAATNVIDGGAGNDTLDGRAGADTMVGGAGRDVYWVDDVGDVVVETESQWQGGGIDLVASRLAAYTLGANVEDGRIVSSGDANLTGNALSNTLYAGDGDNVLDGGFGIDTVSYLRATGGVRVSVPAYDDEPQVTGGSGTDRFVSIENLTGSAHADRLGAGAGANRLDGGRGADILAGGAGDDTYVVDEVGDVIAEAAGGGNDRILSSAAEYTIAASVESAFIVATGAATMTGNGLDNLIGAGAGDNRIDGGAGIDTVSWADAGAAIVARLDATGPQATGGSGSETLIAIENLIGSAFADQLAGNAGANRLDGGTGNDTLIGGAGDDTYVIDAPGDTIVEAADGGIDRVIVDVNKRPVFALDAQIENVDATGSWGYHAGAFSVAGNSQDNLFLISALSTGALDGGEGADTLEFDSPYAGRHASIWFDDVVVSLTTSTASVGWMYSMYNPGDPDTGEGENDDYDGGNATYSITGFENLVGSVSDSTLEGDSGANRLEGQDGDDHLDGRAGDDTLIGGSGDDSLIGGDGADLFVLLATPHVGYGQIDHVDDLVTGIDRIGIDRSTGIGDGDALVEGAVTRSAPGGFAATAELVIFTADMVAGDIHIAENAAPTIGSATSAYAAGATALFVVDDGLGSAVYLFTSAGNDALVSAGELTCLALLNGTPATVSGDYLFGA